MGVHQANSGELLRDTLDMLILKAVEHRALHGYAIVSLIQNRSDSALKVEEGALYPALHRLEVRGLLDSEWGLSESKRRAKYYRLTSTGHRQLEKETARWKFLSAAVTRVMETA
jgi:PadR family transcriptional regulator PadR